MSDGFTPDGDGFAEDPGPAAPPLSLGAKLGNMIGRAGWAIPGLVGLDHDTVQAAAEAAKGGTGSFGERFRSARTAANALSARVDEENPIISGIVRGVAGAPGEALLWALAPEVKLAQGAKALARGAAYGPRLGTLAGLSEYGSTPQKEPGERVAGAASTGLAGAALGGLMGAALPNPAALAPAQTLGERLRGTAINQGRKTLTGNSAPMATRKPLSDEAIQAAYDVGAIRPLGTVESAAERLTVAREAAGDRYAQIVAALEAKGIKGPNAILLARKLAAEADAIETNSLGSPAPGMYRDISLELQGLRQGMHGPVAGVPKVSPAPFADKRLRLTQAEDMKRSLQRAAQGEYVKEGPQSLSGEAKTDLASTLRQAIEDAVTAQAHLAPEEAAAFVPVKQRVGALIEASNAANRGAARAANRQQFGLGPKVLAGGALASGNVPGAAATLIGTSALRNRGPATLGWAANKGANLADFFARARPGKPMTMTPEAATIIELLRAQPTLRLLPAAAEDE
jgi:hypothetical protein